MPLATLTFPNGDRYRSSSIDLHVADETTWSFGFPPDAEVAKNPHAFLLP